MGALVSFGFVADHQIWKSANCATHTATLNRSVLGRRGYMLRCTRRCRAPIILLTSLIRINAGSFGGELACVGRISTISEIGSSRH